MAKSLAILATLAEFSAMSTKRLAVNSGTEVCVINVKHRTPNDCFL